MERLHALLAARADHTPRALNATNTHDTKRSADVRSRLDALSEYPASWERRIRMWRRRHRPLRRIVRGRLAPTRTTDYFIYQALVGIWPIGSGTVHEDSVTVTELRARLTEYIEKALREAKVSTSWTDPDIEYEGAVWAFTAALLDRASPARYLRDIAPLVAEVGGIWNALSRLVVHLTAPGVPDVYRGDELWYQALVDPDNRRPVDWDARDARLDEIRAPATRSGWCPTGRRAAPMARARGGRHAQALPDDAAAPVAARRRAGAHLRLLPSDGGRRRARRTPDRVPARRGRRRPDVLVPRMTSGLGPGAPIGARWDDTRVRLDSEGADGWRLLSGAAVSAHDRSLAVSSVLAELPMAVLAPTKSL